ncbi:hypothetical protein KKG51_03140, partial [Patescibacteria group bacterium]|nr:hypothetical protein [Patescibacteria group bacterium]
KSNSRFQETRVAEKMPVSRLQQTVNNHSSPRQVCVDEKSQKHYFSLQNTSQNRARRADQKRARAGGRVEDLQHAKPHDEKVRN